MVERKKAAGKGRSGCDCVSTESRRRDSSTRDQRTAVAGLPQGKSDDPGHRHLSLLLRPSDSLSMSLPPLHLKRRVPSCTLTVHADGAAGGGRSSVNAFSCPNAWRSGGGYSHKRFGQHGLDWVSAPQWMRAWDGGIRVRSRSRSYPSRQRCGFCNTRPILDVFMLHRRTPHCTRPASCQGPPLRQVPKSDIFSRRSGMMCCLEHRSGDDPAYCVVVGWVRKCPRKGATHH